MIPDTTIDVVLWIAEHLPHLVAAAFIAFSCYLALVHDGELRDAYERGRQDERKRAVAWLGWESEASLRPGSGYIRRLAAAELRDGKHHQPAERRLGTTGE